jgi:hypothetical protein
MPGDKCVPGMPTVERAFPGASGTLLSCLYHSDKRMRVAGAQRERPVNATQRAAMSPKSTLFVLLQLWKFNVQPVIY